MKVLFIGGTGLISLASTELTLERDIELLARRTGLSDEVFRRCIELGCAKINISTQLKYAFIDGFVDRHRAHPDYNPLKVIDAQFDRIRDEMAAKMELFGSGRSGPWRAVGPGAQ